MSAETGIVEVPSEGFRTAMTADFDLTNYLTHSDGTLKVYSGMSDVSKGMPWVRMRYLRGGEDNLAPIRAIDQLWAIEAVAEDQPLATTVAGFVQRALQGARPNLPGDWRCWAGITQTSAIQEPVTIQNRQFWAVGGVYRIRATLAPS